MALWNLVPVQPLFILVCLWNFQFITAIPIDNGVVSQPDIACLEDSMRILVHTANTFHGHIYIKGMFQVPGCHLDLTGSFPGHTTTPYEVPYRGCVLVSRERSVNPPGLSYTATVIVQFHHLFITKVDRAYRLTCFYMEAEKRVTQNIEVSMIPTTQLIAQRRMPTCSYSVVAGDLNGPVVRYAKVGDKVFHKWTCEEGVHGMLVHSCIARDGAGTGYRLIDERGCAVDPIALGDLSYSVDLAMAWTQVHVFKFADQMLLVFQCEITLCLKAHKGCEGITPPLCTEYSPYPPAPVPPPPPPPSPPGPYLPGPPPIRPVPFPPQPPGILPSLGQPIDPGPAPLQILGPPGPPIIEPDNFAAQVGLTNFPQPAPMPIQLPLTFRPPFGPYADDDPQVDVQRDERSSSFLETKVQQKMKNEMKKKNLRKKKDTLDLSTEDILVFNLDEEFQEKYLPKSKASISSNSSTKWNVNDVCLQKLTLTQIIASIILFFSSLLVLLAFCQRRYYLDKILQAKRRSPS